MTEHGDSSAPAGQAASALAWSLAGVGAGMALTWWWLSGFSGERWLLGWAAVLAAVAIAVAFFGFVRRGGLDSSRATEQPHLLTPLAGLLTGSAVLAVTAGLHSRLPPGASAPDGAARRALSVPGLELSLPPTRALEQNIRRSRISADLVGPPTGALTVEWETSADAPAPDRLRAAAESLTGTWGALEQSSDYAGPDARGAAFAFRDGRKHTAIVLARCTEQPLSMTITVTSSSQSGALGVARDIADSARCTGEAPVPEAFEGWPTSALGDRFGLVDLGDQARLFESVDGETLVLHRDTARAVETLQRDPQALRRSLAAGVTIDEWTTGRWPIGHGAGRPLWSFEVAKPDASDPPTLAYATTLLCPADGVGFVVLATGNDRATMLARLVSVSCPRSGQPVPAYESFEQVATRLCKQGDASACAARQRAK